MNATNSAGNRVSVVIPAYNYGHFVCETVESALAQTHVDLEVIVVDDGSTDDTRLRLEPYMRRIRYIHQQNRGLSAARNTGIQHAQGDWVALLDADDLWHPQKIEIQLDAAQRLGNIALVGSRPAPLHKLAEPLPTHHPIQTLTVRDFLLSAPMGPSSALIRRSAFDVVGLFDESLTSVEDRDMWLRIAARFPTARVDAPIWWYRLHPNQMNRNPQRMLDNYQAVLTKFLAQHPQHRAQRGRAWGYLHLDTALSYLDQGNRSKTLVHLMKSLASRPWSLGDPNRSWVRSKILVRLLLGDRIFRMLRPQPATIPAPGESSRMLAV